MYFVFSEKAEAWARRQVTGQGDISENYTTISEDEYAVYAPYIGQPKRVLDLACGIGRVSVFLSRYLPGASFVLADSSQGDPAIKPPYGFDDRSFYNDLGVTGEFCWSNGMRDFATHDVAPDGLAALDQWPDLIISMLGIGFHVPLEECIEELHSISRPDTTLVFGVAGHDDRPQWEQEHDFTRWFGSQVTVPFESRYRTHEGRILVLSDKVLQ